MSEGKGVQDPRHLPKPELHLSRWKLNGLSHGTAKAKRRDSQVPVSGAAGSCPMPPMAGRDSPHLRGSKDTARRVRLQYPEPVVPRPPPPRQPCHGGLLGGQGPKPEGQQLPIVAPFSCRLPAEAGLSAGWTGVQALREYMTAEVGLPPCPAAGLACRAVCSSQEPARGLCWEP